MGQEAIVAGLILLAGFALGVSAGVSFALGFAIGARRWRRSVDEEK